MAEKTYKVCTPIQRGKKTAKVGDLIQLDEEDGAPLVECGALVEQESVDSPKAKGK